MFHLRKEGGDRSSYYQQGKGGCEEAEATGEEAEGERATGERGSIERKEGEREGNEVPELGSSLTFPNFETAEERSNISTRCFSRNKASFAASVWMVLF